MPQVCAPFPERTLRHCEPGSTCTGAAWGPVLGGVVAELPLPVGAPSNHRPWHSALDRTACSRCRRPAAATARRPPRPRYRLRARRSPPRRRPSPPTAPPPATSTSEPVADPSPSSMPSPSAHSDRQIDLPRLSTRIVTLGNRSATRRPRASLARGADPAHTGWLRIPSLDTQRATDFAALWPLTPLKLRIADQVCDNRRQCGRCDPSPRPVTRWALSWPTHRPPLDALHPDGQLLRRQVPTIVRGERGVRVGLAGPPLPGRARRPLRRQRRHGRTELRRGRREAGRGSWPTSPLWSYAHPKAVELAEKIASLTRPTFNRVFFTTGGFRGRRGGVEAGPAYFKRTGKPNKHKVVSRYIAYHRHVDGRACRSPGVNVRAL